MALPEVHRESHVHNIHHDNIVLCRGGSLDRDWEAPMDRVLERGLLRLGHRERGSSHSVLHEQCLRDVPFPMTWCRERGGYTCSSIARWILTILALSQEML